MDDNYGKTGVAIQMGGRLLPTDFYELVKDDRHFIDVITKICKKIEWINDEGIYIDGGSADGDKPSIEELILEYLRSASKDEEGQKITYDVLEKAYFDNNYSNLEPAKFKR